MASNVFGWRWWRHAVALPARRRARRPVSTPCGRGVRRCVQFHPDGASTGAVLKLSREKAEYEIRVNLVHRRCHDCAVDGRKGLAGVYPARGSRRLGAGSGVSSRTWSALVAGAPHHEPCRRRRGSASSAALVAGMRAFDRTGLANASRKGEASELRWRIVAEPCSPPRPALPDQPRWLAISRDGKRGVGLRSGHHGRNDTARQAGAMKMQRGQARVGCDGFTLVGSRRARDRLRDYHGQRCADP